MEDVTVGRRKGDWFSYFIAVHHHSHLPQLEEGEVAAGDVPLIVVRFIIFSYS